MAKKRKEWREIVDVHSVELYRTDVIELINILASSEDFEKPELEMQVTSDSQTITGDPLNEDFANFEFEKSDQVQIRLSVWRDTETDIGDTKYNNPDIVSGISLSMNVNHINYHIHSYSETWFRGKKEQLNRFFEKHKSVLPNQTNKYKLFKLINNIIFVIAFALVFYFIINKNYLFTTISAVLVIVTSLIPLRKPETKRPPFVMVNFVDRPNEEIVKKTEIPWVLIVNILALAVAIIGLFL